jgi:hypothetical protein
MERTQSIGDMSPLFGDFGDIPPCEKTKDVEYKELKAHEKETVENFFPLLFDAESPTGFKGKNPSIELRGNLSKTISAENPQGKVYIAVNVSKRGDEISKYYLDITDKGNDIPSTEVYWLPWKNNDATYVTLDDLNKSGCKYFMTSELSGCRFSFVKAPKDNGEVGYLAHIANNPSQNIDPTQRARSKREKEIADKELFNLGGAHRRSASTSVKADDFSTKISCSENHFSSYAKIDDHGQLKQGSGKGLIVGKKDANGEWHFIKQFNSTSPRDNPMIQDW